MTTIGISFTLTIHCSSRKMLLFSNVNHYLRALCSHKGSISKVTSIQINNRSLITSTSLHCKNKKEPVTENTEISEVYRRLRGQSIFTKKNLHNLKKEFIKFYDEQINYAPINRPWQFVNPSINEIDMAFAFETETEFNLFQATTDQDMKLGYSTAKLEYTDQKTALFTGNLSTKLTKNSEYDRTGFVNLSCQRKVKSFNRKGYYDWSYYTHIVLKVRGDGRPWLMILATPLSYKETISYQFCHPLYTRGGPYWQITKIPFNHFFFTNQSRISQGLHEVPILNKIAKIGFTLSDNRDGPFKLEIDYIGLLYDPRYEHHTTIYESYHSYLTD